MQNIDSPRNDLAARISSAEAAYDAQETTACPDDRVSFYLERLEIVTSHLADVITGLASDFDFESLVVGKGDLFALISVCVRRVEDAGAAKVMDDASLKLWNSFKTAVAALEGRAVESSKAVQFANIVFIASIVLIYVCGRPSQWVPSAAQSIIQTRARSLPFPLSTELDLSDQAQVVTRNLQWLHEQLYS